MSKVCSKCKILKKIDEFGICNGSKDLHKYACKICLRAQGRDYVKRNRKKCNDNLKKWRKNHPGFHKYEYKKYHESKLKCAKKYYYNNRLICLERQSKWRKKSGWFKNNKELVKKIGKLWKINNPERSREISRKSASRYRARKKFAVTYNFSIEQLMQRMSIFGFKCAYCNGLFEQIDHVIPLSRGGGHYLSNLRPSCKRCNSSKSNKLLREWKNE
jgi:5-methylcytosine-specific restriction endonuclease McrA